MTRPVEISELVAALTADLERLCAALMPLGRREGAEWVEAPRGAGGRGDSLKVHLRGSRRGVWAHFAAGADARGDALDLIAYLACGGDKRAAIQWGKEFLGLAEGGAVARAPAMDAGKIAAARAAREAETAADEARRRRNALAIWREADERIKGSPVELYLAGRGIDLARMGRVPRALRFHPRLHHPQLKAFAPAMVACVTRGDEIAGIHRTWLADDGGRWSKIAGATAKMTLGRYSGGAVRIWRGAERSPWAEGRGPVALTEGIEDALTVALALPELRVAAAVSLANMRAVALPAGVTEVVLVADNDGAGTQAARALEAAAAAHAAQGRAVRIARAPGGAKDVNDLLMGAR